MGHENSGLPSERSIVQETFLEDSFTDVCIHCAERIIEEDDVVRVRVDRASQGDASFLSTAQVNSLLAISVSIPFGSISISCSREQAWTTSSNLKMCQHDCGCATSY